MRPMFNGRHHIPLCRSIRAQLVGDDPLRRLAWPLQQPDQQSLGGLRVATRPDDFIENVRVVINGAPEPVLPSADGDHHRVQMPDIRSRRTFSAQLLGISRTEFATPSVDGFLGSGPRYIIFAKEMTDVALPLILRFFALRVDRRHFLPLNSRRHSASFDRI